MKVVCKRHRSGTEIGAGVLPVLRLFASLFGQGVNEVVQCRAALVGQQLPRTQLLDAWLEHAERQRQVIAQGPA